MQKISAKKRYLAIGVGAAGIISIAIWAFGASSAPKQDPPAVPVKTLTTADATLSVPLAISGFVRGENQADISPATSGKILRIFRREGQAVKKGEVLAIIEDKNSDAQVAAASASAKALEKTLEGSQQYYDQLVRQAKDAPSSDAADQAVKSAKKARDLQIEAARSQLIAAQGSLGMAQAGKNNATLVAPFAGIITAIHGREGGFANFSMPLISLSAPGSYEIETYVSAADSRSVAVGAIANFETKSEVPVSGIVTAVSTGADSQSLKTFIRIKISDAQGSVRLGDFLRGQIMLTSEDSAISIPRSAVVSRGGDPTVFVLDENNVARQQAIKIGAEHSGFIGVTEGLSANQKIVIEGQQYLITGLTTTPYAAN